MLPRIIPQSRIMVYNYDSRWHMDAPKTRLQLCGEELVHSVHRFRNGINRPIIFIGHSLGGNVIQHGLLFADNHDQFSYMPSVTVGLIFLGTPFRGSKMQSYANIAVQSLAMMASHGGIIQDLTYDNPALTDRLHAFCNLQRKERLPTCCFFKLRETSYGRKLGVPGWAKGMVVEETSACITGLKRFPLQSDHLALNKFQGPDDRSFLSVSDEIRGMVMNSTDLIQQRKLVLSQHHWMVPFGRNRDFTGRESVLEPLHTEISPFSDEDACQRTAIVGLGGIGKTQIALESAYRLRKYCSVFWVPAVDAMTFEKAYREIGEKLGIPGINNGKNDVKRLVKDALSRDSFGNWLLIIDNADDPDLLFGKAALSEYLPSSLKGSILFTTRTQQVVQRLDISPRNTINLGEMTKGESVELLKKLHASAHDDHESVESLLDLLVCLPLAIKQAAAYMGETGVSVAQYLQFCRSSDKAQARLISKDFGDQYRYTEIENPIATTWIISFRQIERDKPAAATYLEFICLLGEREIPLSLIPYEGDEMDVAEAVGILKAYALITEHEEPGLYDIHRLVRLAMRAWMDRKGTLEKYSIDLLQWISDIYPKPEYDNKHIWGRYLPHAESLFSSCPHGKHDEVHEQLLSKIGVCYASLGKYKEAETMLRRALQATEKGQGPEHPATLANLIRLGGSFFDQGRYQDAEIMHRRALQGSEKILGPVHPCTLSSMVCLGNDLERQGRYKEAETMHRRALRGEVKVYGLEHPGTFSTLNNLNNALLAQGQYKKAARTAQRVLQGTEKVLGPEHPSTLASIRNFGKILVQQDQYEKAEEMFRRAVQGGEKLFGPQHPKTLSFLHNLGVALGLQGQHKEAELIFRHVLRSTEVLQPNHPDILLTYDDLGVALLSLNQYEEAEQVLQQAVQSAEKALGPEHSYTLLAAENLKLALERQGKPTLGSD
ncbi:TPR-like protein [Aspergillus sclerotioniger CBS 115572]|uniref:TPR-like protein n=1 Tax=Aspergillus sclerotioniger CBS 115572 TaxID=1450535 RepID=A0A317W9R6_9EURO|nr:TPR-like protein [Aspergillus sclerotioniger CBS 115572]PWY81718.1 TPR-like protein [Aspergillus sclerotioniger CBS 115572]